MQEIAIMCEEFGWMNIERKGRSHVFFFLVKGNEFCSHFDFKFIDI